MSEDNETIGMKDMLMKSSLMNKNKEIQLHWRIIIRECQAALGINNIYCKNIIREIVVYNEMNPKKKKYVDENLNLLS